MSNFKVLQAFILVNLTLMLLVAFYTPAGGENKKQASPAASRAAAANTGFGLNLFAKLNQAGQGENIFLSPASIVWCLNMVLNGAEGKTKEEMARVLQVDGMNLTDLNNAYRDWKNSWVLIDPKVEIEVANSIWSKRGIAIRPEFIEINRTFLGSEVTELDFNDPRSLTTINSWVKNKTRSKIDKIVDQISPESVLFLINAIYFNGKWTTEFDATKTTEDSFTTGSGVRKLAPMMRQRGTYSYQEQPEFQAISLPYGNGRLSMNVFLPSTESSLKTFHNSLTASNWEQWMKQFQEMEGEIVLPRFRVEYEASLNSALKTLGMRSAFDAQQADFGGMTSAKAFISDVKHKAFVEVNEEGTEAAAATSTEVRVVSMPIPTKTFRMVVNRPFFFAIRDNSTGLVLFVGSIVDPK